MVSHLGDDVPWLDDVEKEEFLRQLERFAAGYFVHLHAFCVMSNHFHLLVTGQEEQGKAAAWSEMVRRYRRMFGRRADPPAGALQQDGSIDPDPDGGEQRLRDRLSSISRFLQDLKQSFAKWLNKHRGRRGSLWRDRFGAVVTEKVGDAELVQSAYIDLNPVRAKMVRRPEDYRWSSMGLSVRDPRRARALLAPLSHPEIRRKGPAWYRVFVYCAGLRAKDADAGRLSEADVAGIVERAGSIGVLRALRYRCRNLSEGVLVGSAPFVAAWQRRNGRKHVAPRGFLAKASGAISEALCGTRVLRAPP